MQNLPLKLSISTHREAGYRAVEVEFCELHKYINFEGFYSACFFNKAYRKGENFIGGNTILILDFDEGLTIQNAQDIFKVHPYLITTTRNHQKWKDGKPPCDRFRLIFPLKEPIDLTGIEFTKLMTYIINVYGSDPKTCDAARFFYGVPDGKHLYNFEGELFDWRHWYNQIPPEPERKRYKKEFKPCDSYDIDKLKRECAQMKRFTEKQTELSYAEWLHGCGVIAFLPNGNELVHFYSCEDERYNEAETERNYQDVIGKGATRCSTFYPLNPLCHTCIYKGVLNSPYTLGTDSTSVLTESLPVTPEELERKINLKPNLLDSFHNRKVSFHSPVRRDITETLQDNSIQICSDIEEASEARFEHIKAVLESMPRLVAVGSTVV